MTYKFKYKKFFFWKTKEVIGHRLDKDINRMDLYLPDGSVISMPQWDKYTLHLGADWVVFTKTQMQKETGVEIK